MKRQQIEAKKIYGIDLGLINSVGFQFSPNTVKLLENLVFLALRRQSKEITITHPQKTMMLIFIYQTAAN